jgi:hypothetical protein
MIGAVIAFPKRRSLRVRDNLGLDRVGGRLRPGKLDEELRTIDSALKALNRRKRSVLMRYRAEFKRLGEAEAATR